MQKFTFDSVIVEVTRRCNLRCKHCLRGTAEKVDLDLKYWRKLLTCVECIGTLSVTGGEPSLVPEIVRDVVKEVRKRKIPVDSTYITVNGTKPNLSDGFKLALADLLGLGDCREITGLAISSSEWHCNEKTRDEVYRQLSVFKNTEWKTFGALRLKILPRGRAMFLDLPRDRVYARPYDFLDIEKYTDKDVRVLGDLYLNVYGEVHTDCDLSYAMQARKDPMHGYLCHVDELMETLIQSECIINRKS